MTRSRDEVRFIVLCFLTDLLVFWLCLNAATLTRLPTLVYFSLWRLQGDRLVCLVLFALGMTMMGAYRLYRISDAFDAIYYAWAGLCVAGFVEMALVSLLPVSMRAISRRELFLSLLLAAVVLAFWRYCAAGLAARFPSLRRFFHVLGGEREANRIVTAIREREYPQSDAEFMTPELLRERLNAQGHAGHHEGPVLEKPALLSNEEAIVAMTLKASGTEDSARLLHETLVLCESYYRRVFLYPSIEDARLFRLGKIHAVAGIPLVELPGAVTPPPYLYVKRLFDVCMAGLGLLAALPICLVTALLIKLTSPGGVFYSQTRMGRNGREFKLYKFRTMVQNAEAQTGPVWAASNDARVTPVGRFLRKHRIDEIPQLISVLKGDMSLIGPRPERPHFHREFCEQWPLFDRRLMVRPGLTSLSHVLGSYSSDPEDRLRYDLIYIGNLSFLTDLQILVATIRVVLGAKGAQ